MRIVAGRVAGVLAVATALGALTRGAEAQVALTLAQTPNVFPAPTVADYNGGWIVNPTGILFTVDHVGGGQPTNRTTTIAISSTSATLGGGKSIGDLEWRRADLVAWNPMTLIPTTVESRTVRRNGINDPWSNQVFLRIKLKWLTDPPATYSAPIVLTLTVTTP